MTASPENLIKMFADGEMPTGASFKLLITSMTPLAEFEDHKAEITKWRENGEIHMGHTGSGWTMHSDGADTISFAPDTPEDTAPEKSHIDLYGWTTGFGRTGTGKDPDRFKKLGLLDRSTMGEEPCGKWVTLLNPPAGLSATEIVIATEQQPLSQSTGAMRLLHWLIGLQAHEPDICHAIATTRARGLKPSIVRTNPTRSWGLIKRSLIEGPLLALALSGLHRLALIAELDVPSGWIAIAIMAIWALRRGVQLISLRNLEIRLRWKANGKKDAAGMKVHWLQARGPKPPNDPDAMLHYHISALWG